MKKAVYIVFILIQVNLYSQYNNLWIPDTLSGTQFNLTIKDTFAQLVSKGNPIDKRTFIINHQTTPNLK